MGDPRKPRKKYKTPSHPWEKERIEAEAELLKTFGLKNKKEIQKMNSILASLKVQAKKYIADSSAQGEKEKTQLIQKVQRLGILDASASLDDILGLTIESILERRLQTVLFRKGFTRTIKQARQAITHRHVTLGSKKITAPGALCSKKDEATLGFHDLSAFSSEDHPERPKEEAQKIKVSEKVEKKEAK